MLIELIKRTQPLFMKKWGIRVGDKFDVIGKPDTYTSREGTKTSYLVYTGNNKALVLYSSEIKILRQ